MGKKKTDNSTKMDKANNKNVTTNTKENNRKKEKKKISNKVKLNNKNNVSESAGIELKKLSTIFVSVIGIVCLFYIITVFVSEGKGGLKYQSTDEVSTISYVDILASDILNKDGEYYVLVKNNDDAYLDLYSTYINSYVASEESLWFYYVDLNDSLNQKYKDDESNFSKDNLKFNGTTLLKISNGNIDNIYSDSDSISKHLKSLSNK